MTSLSLTPLPSSPSAEEPVVSMVGMLDFVDEAVVRALMSKPVFAPSVERTIPNSNGTGDPMDFAGWGLSQPVAAPLESRFEEPPSAKDSEQSAVVPLFRHASPRGYHRAWKIAACGLACASFFPFLSTRLQKEKEARSPVGNASESQGAFATREHARQTAAGD